MENGQQWIIIDVETTAAVENNYRDPRVIELAAQRMAGWTPIGEPFTRILNPEVYIAPSVEARHGHTRASLRREGVRPWVAYRDFRSYVDGLPLVAYGTDCDLETVLLPEWALLGISRIGCPGFCALRLSRRLIDPCPAGSHRLQVLRRFYNLPERNSHTALADVLTTVDLFTDVLRPIAGKRGLYSFRRLAEYADAEWYPRRIPFGPCAGQSTKDLYRNKELQARLEVLAHEGGDAARAARWYLSKMKQQLARDVEMFGEKWEHIPPFPHIHFPCY